MKKVPIVETIVSAYRFTFGDLGTVIGLIWLPLILYTLGRFFVMNYVQAVGGSSSEASGQALLVLVTFSLVSLFLTAVMGVSLTRQAMAPKPGKVVAQFVIGPAEFNYFLALVSVFLIMIAIYIAAFIADVAIAGLKDVLAGALGIGVGQKAIVALTIAAVVALDLAILIYIGVRLAFLVAPVTVAEGKIDLARAWTLSRGNFWRMFAILIVTVGPIFIVGEVAFAAVVGPAYVIAFARAFLEIMQAVAVGAAPPTQLLDKLPDIAAKTPMLLGINFLLAPFSYGLMFAAPAFSYRALVGGSPSARAPDMGPLRPA